MVDTNTTRKKKLNKEIRRKCLFVIPVNCGLNGLNYVIRIRMNNARVSKRGKHNMEQL